MNTKAAVIIPTFDHRDSIRRCLLSLLRHDLSDYKTYVVDAGSSDDTRQLIATQFHEVQLLHGTPDLWWAGSVNIGIRKALADGAEQIIVLNDDCVLIQNTIQRLLETAASHPNSIIAAVCCYLDDPKRIFFAGRVRSKRTDRFVYLDQNRPVDTLGSGLRNVDLLHGMCTLFPSRLFHDIGMFDEKTFPHLFADDDLVLTAATHGYQPLVRLDAVILNDRSKTGLNPYDRRTGPLGAIQLLVSRRSAYQMSTRAKFLWRHRSSNIRFVKTFILDYARLFAMILAKWFLSKKQIDDLAAKIQERHIK